MQRNFARRGSEQADLDARGVERLDYFATQLGRLEGLADARSAPPSFRMR